ncbi:MAG: hypothetical protein HYU88_06360 [Chloroflexi bacterium]|nr:hypothetical protein [Chloroflexota bacterium]MBI4507591.1 hypothetical protein [Chloroflexota bacterium]
MPDQTDHALADVVRTAAAHQGIAFNDTDLATAPAALKSILDALAELEQRFGIAALEPTAYTRFDG